MQRSNKPTQRTSFLKHFLPSSISTPNLKIAYTLLRVLMMWFL